MKANRRYINHLCLISEKKLATNSLGRCKCSRFGSPPGNWPGTLTVLGWCNEGVFYGFYLSVTGQAVVIREGRHCVANELMNLSL